VLVLGARKYIISYVYADAVLHLAESGLTFLVGMFQLEFNTLL